MVRIAIHRPLYIEYSSVRVVRLLHDDEGVAHLDLRKLADILDQVAPSHRTSVDFAIGFTSSRPLARSAVAQRAWQTARTGRTGYTAAMG
jgi:hypothetical protein